MSLGPPGSTRTDTLFPHTTRFRSGSARRQLRKAVVITVEPGAFRDSLDDGGRLAGLDVGVKTIGIALCDAGWTIASPAETIRRTKFSKDMAALSAFCAAHAVKGQIGRAHV